MMFRPAIALTALIAFAAPAFAQHGGTHGGSFRTRGFVSGHTGFSQPNSIARSGQPSRYGSLGGAGLQRNRPRNYSGLRSPYNNNRFVAAHPSLYSRNAGLFRTSDQERDPFGARKRSFENWYAHIYPNWLGYGYPYVIDPGFYDWGDSGNSGYEQDGASPLSPASYSDQGYGSLSQQPATTGSTSPSKFSPEQSLTVIFKSVRDPVKMQNYMMTARVLTDLDSRHYEQIPMDQIDLAATQQVNSASGVEFQIPSASRD